MKEVVDVNVLAFPQARKPARPRRIATETIAAGRVERTARGQTQCQITIVGDDARLAPATRGIVGVPLAHRNALAVQSLGVDVPAQCTGLARVESRPGRALGRARLARLVRLRIDRRAAHAPPRLTAIVRPRLARISRLAVLVPWRARRAVALRTRRQRRTERAFGIRDEGRPGLVVVAAARTRGR